MTQLVFLSSGSKTGNLNNGIPFVPDSQASSESAPGVISTRFQAPIFRTPAREHTFFNFPKIYCLAIKNLISLDFNSSLRM